MKICLVNPKYVKGASRHAPLGISYIASFLNANGYDVNILDLEAENISFEKAINKVIDYNPDLVGFSCLTPQYTYLTKFAKKIKEYDEQVITVFGGPHPSAMPVEVISNSFIDFVVTGEGEITMLELARCVEGKVKLSNLSGIVYKKNRKIIQNSTRRYIKDLDIIPFPARHLLNMEHYTFPFFDSKLRTTNIMGSRGCPYNCNFCYKGIFGNKWRGRNPENIVKEIELLIEKYNIEGIYFTDDTFNLSHPWVKKLCELLKNGVKIEWGAGGIRADMVTYEILKIMKDSGCRWIGIGVESGDQKILNWANKGLKIQQIIKAFKLCKSLNIKTFAYFMIGFPFETRDSLMKTIQLIKLIRPNDRYVSICMPWPGTKLYNLSKNRGWIQDNFSWEKFDYTYSDFTISQNFTLSELKIFREKIYEEIRNITYDREY